ncbi:DMT family transporter [Castellaniella sp.]|uniref:DMT family transporter n=1 Tax=Castellaniella sp. TaxID=1955812 RepID=UPI002AFEA234|nr:DMT family transporter [Castellaniella sp.]
MPEAPSTRPQNPVIGIAFILTGVLALTLSDAFAKWLTAAYPPIQILFLRALIALPIIMGVVTALAGQQALRSRYLPIHLLRGAINIAAAACFYTGLMYLPLAENTAVAFAAPLFVTVLSVFILKETVDRHRWAAVLIGFLGVLLIVRPGADSFQPAALFPLMTALLYGAMMMTARAIGPAEGMLTTTLYIVVGQLVFSVLLIPWFWEPIQWAHLPFFLAIALCSTLGLGLITQAFRVAPASVVAPFDYSGLLWAAVLGWLFWDEIPDLLAYLGVLLIAGSGVYIALREARASRRRRAKP